MTYVELFSPMFWLSVLALSAGFIAIYFIGRQAILDALEEHDRRKRLRDEQDRVRGGRR